MQNASLNQISPSNLKAFLKKLCIVSTRYEKKEEALFGIKKYNIFHKSIEIKLRARIQQLEEDLLKISEERDKALEENRDKMKELGNALMSVRAGLNKLLQAKKEKEERLKYLEKKIRKTVKTD